MSSLNQIADLNVLNSELHKTISYAEIFKYDSPQIPSENKS